MKTIPLRAVPNQRFTFSNGQDRWVIEIKVAISSMICNLWLNDEPVILGSRIVAGVPIIWAPRLATGGNFGILTEGGEEPWWESFGTTQQMVFWENNRGIGE